MPEVVSRKTGTMMGINRLWVCALPSGMLQIFRVGNAFGEDEHHALDASGQSPNGRYYHEHDLDSLIGQLL
jgi:hypothetical protein